MRTPVKVGDEVGAREIEFRHGAWRLTGTVQLPPVGMPRAAVAFVHGSGVATRDVWRAMAERMALAGVATLRYDKPGCGQSEGDWTAQGFEDRAHEALAALQALSEQLSRPGPCIGLAGGSQGGWIVLLAASLSPAVEFAVCFSAAGVSPAEQEAYRIAHQLPADGLSTDECESALAIFRRRLELMRAGASAVEIWEHEAPFREERWYPLLGATTLSELEFDLRVYDFEATTVLERVRCPILAIWGERDLLVPVDASLAAFDAARNKTDRLEDELHVIVGADHRLRQPGSDDIPAVVTDTTVSWITRICPPPH